MLATLRRTGPTGGLTPTELSDALLVSSASGQERNTAIETAITVLTSGTTGPPKRLPLSWAALGAMVVRTPNAPGISHLA